LAVPSIVWFRQDLRVRDQAALAAAAAEGPVVPVYILDDERPGQWRIGGAQRWWLNHSLAALRKDVPGLVLRRGDCVAELARLAAETGATRIHAIRHYEPWWREAEAELAADHDLVLHDGGRLLPPAALLTGGGTRYRMFTPWWRALLERMPPAKPLPAPEKVGTVPTFSEALEDWHLLPTKPNWATGFTGWTPGEEGARQALRSFLARIKAYDTARNLPSRPGSSRLSPHLHHGEISPATVWHIISKEAGKDAESYLREIGWRDYAANLIDQFPHYGERNGKPPYDRFPWRTGKQADADFAAWTKGRTGYPIVDAGMRELWTTGFMHNRVRMIAASFLIKHLLIDWRRGAKWFWDTLVDADYPNNSANWQWVAGTGLDAPLFSRIMAPLSQSEKFEAGDYIRKWVPELAELSDAQIHDPEEAGARPADYPEKLIGHREARERALAGMRQTRDNAG
jgi:deoxyribodipyrimidine photo-lyase